MPTATLRFLLPPALLLGVTASCNLVGIGGPDTERLIVQHYAAECVGLTVQQCLLVKEPGQADFTFSYGWIEGFDYEWGYIYEVEVEKRTVPNPPQDGSSIRVILRDIKSKTRIPSGTEFDLYLTSGLAQVTTVSAGRYRYLGWPDLSCASGVACSDLTTQLSVQLGNDKRVHLRLAQPATSAEPLRVLAWEVITR